ncbi:MAG TPA: DUF2807 domain-containing protein [Caulobacteraceae bacterium]|jgi:hypothetical protein|nr:DUF2807 domain-containing protein [Caulobacteraceae bacterium]
MKIWLAMAACVAGLAGGGAATAAEVIIHDAAMRVTVIPEARSDVSVETVRSNPRFHITFTRIGDDISIDGGLGLRPRHCGGFFGRPGIVVWGIGRVPYEALPQLVIRTPMDVKVRARDAVYGVIGRAASAELDNAGCGDWKLANIAGPARVRVAGSGDVRAASAGSAEVRISGSSDVTFNNIRGGLTSAVSGSGNLRAASVNGPMRVRVAGSGDVIAHGGQVTDMQVSVAGSGDVRFGGVAQNLQASVAGSGDVSVGKVMGSVTRHVAGSGTVTVGS